MKNKNRDSLVKCSKALVKTLEGSFIQTVIFGLAKSLKLYHSAKQIITKMFAKSHHTQTTK